MQQGIRFDGLAGSTLKRWNWARGGSSCRIRQQAGEGGVADGEGQVDAGAAAGGFVGGENQFGGLEGLAGAEDRFAAGLEGLNEVLDGSVDGGIGVDVFGGGDDLPVGLAFGPDAKLHAVGGGYFDGAFGADEAIVAAIAGLKAGDQEAADAVVEFEVAEALAFDGGVEDFAMAAEVDLADDPVEGGVAVVVAKCVEPVGAPVVEVAALGFHAEELSDGAAGDEFARFGDGFGEAALVVEGQLNAAIAADLGHAEGVAPGGGHGFFAVDGFDAGFGGGDGHFGVEVGPGADADDVEVFGGEHLVVVGVDGLAAVLLLEAAGQVEADVGQGDEFDVGAEFEGVDVFVGHAEAGGAFGFPGAAGAEDT